MRFESEKVNMFPVLSVVLVLAAAEGIRGSRVVDVRGVQTVLAVENELVKLSCEEDVPISYCGFIHPNGTRFSYSGTSLNSGQCFIELKVGRSDSGPWTCHIGRKDRIGEEFTQFKRMRVGGQLATVEPNITAIHGEETTLVCTTPRQATPLSYCRFVPPVGTPFSIDGTVTRNNSIKGRFFYPANNSVDRGDCAVTIAKVTYEDVGAWVCGAWLDGGSKEFVDVIELSVEGMYNLSTASVTGIVFVAIAVIVLALGALVVWRRRSSGVAAAAPIELADVRRRPSPLAPRVRVDAPDGSGAPLQDPAHELA